MSESYSPENDPTTDPPEADQARNAAAESLA